MPRCYFVSIKRNALFQYRIPAILLPSACLALESRPYGVELVHCSIDEFWLVRQDSGFEIAVIGPFHADAGAGEVRRTDVGCAMIEDEHLEMDAGAEGACSRPVKRGGVAVEVFAEVGPRLLGVDETHFLALFDEIGQEAQKGGLRHRGP